MISKSNAQHLFEKFNDCSLLKAGGQHCGCNHRAHLLAQKLTAQTGQKTGKLWVWSSWGTEKDTFEDMAHTLVIPSAQRHEGLFKKYNFHVAPVLTTEVGDMVFDLALLDRPVSTSCWLSMFAAQEGSRLHTAETPAHVYAINMAVEGRLDKPSVLTRAFHNANAYANLYFFRVHDVGAGDQPYEAFSLKV